MSYRSKTGEVVCSTCEGTGARPGALHLAATSRAAHVDRKDFACEQCHGRGHLIKCDECPATFWNASSYDAHVRRHVERKQQGAS